MLILFGLRERDAALAGGETLPVFNLMVKYEGDLSRKRALIKPVG